MIRYEDLLAARLLYQQLPEQRGTLLAGLEALQAPGAQRSLLASLVSRGVVSMDLAQGVFQQVETFKRARLRGIYAHLLTREGIPAGNLQRLIEQLGEACDADGLGDRILSLGLIPPQREQQLRFQARLAFDRDMAAQVQQHVRTRPQGEAATEGGAPQVNVLTSSVIKKDVVKQLQAAADVEVGALVRGTLSDADEDLPGPRFRIPDSVDMSDPRTGKQVEGYRILGRIGAGAMGVVYLADSQEEPERAVALKLLPKEAAADAKGRFKREILANSFFSHPGALDIYGAGETERGYHYLAMEYFEGRDLEQILEEVGKLPPKTALELAALVFETLGASHTAGLVHRDVKPANILVSADYRRTKLMDFGIAIVRDLGEFESQVFTSAEGGVTGTPEYMAPEQAAGEPSRPASDLYSLGVVLYHALSGRLPFESETSSGYITCHMIEDPLPLAEADANLKALPRDLHELVAELLRKEPDARPASAELVVARLRALIPQIKDKSGTSRFLSFLGWRGS